MKLTQEHIGKMVRSVMWTGVCALKKVIFVTEKELCLQFEDKSLTLVANDEVWEIVEPKKKPSERIEEIYIGKMLGKISLGDKSADFPEKIELHVKAIKEFLDEQDWEARKK